MIRTPSLDEAPALATLCQASVRAIRLGQPPALRDHWAEMLSPLRMRDIIDTQWCIVEGAVPRGFASLEGNDVLGMLYVHPNHQRRGIARQLVNAVAVQATKRGATTLWVDASINAFAAYRSLGFEDEGLQEKTDAMGVTYRVHRMRAPCSLFA